MPFLAPATLLPAALRLMMLCLGLLLAPMLRAESATPALAQCQGMKDLAFVGHMDDDLLFMNPDILDVIREGGCVRVVYLTASERNEGEAYMRNREQAVQAAYAYMAGQPNEWQEETVQVGAYRLASFSLRSRPGIQLWHMRLQDPWLGKGWGSLTPLSRTESSPEIPVETLEASPQRYTRSDLVDTLATVIRTYAPTTVRHLDDTNVVPYTQLCWRCPGHGHPDHIASARLVREAMILAPGNYAQMGYVDYPIQEHAINLAPDEISGKTEAFRRYAWVDYRYCKGEEGCKEPAGPAAAWVGRAYYVTRRDTGAVLAAGAHSAPAPTLLTTGESNDTINLWQAHTGAWQILGGRSSESPSVAIGPDQTALLSRDATGRIWISQQRAEGPWSPWQALAGARLSRMPAIAPEGLAAIGLGTDDRYYWTAAKPDHTTWSPWTPLPALPDARHNAAIALDKQGRLSAIAMNNQGKLHLSRQRSAHSSDWTPWQALDIATVDTPPVAIHDAQGALTLFLRDPDNGHLLHLSQQLTSTHDSGHAMAWDTPQDLGLTVLGRPAVAQDAKGRLVVAVRNAETALWVWQDGKPILLAPAAASDPTLQRLGDTLYVTVRAPGPAQQYLIWHNTQGQWLALPPTSEPPQTGGHAFHAPVMSAVPTTPATPVTSGP